MDDARSTPDESSGGERLRPRRPGSRRLKRVGVTVGVVLVAVFALGVGAEYYTSRSDFCGSCHVMEPYYQSWQSDVHAGEGHAGCVQCHYAPGEQHTVKAKLRGLRQLASYLSSQPANGPRRAHVADASCLAEGCHADRAFMTAEVPIGDVTFSHALHLESGPDVFSEKAEGVCEAHHELADLHCTSCHRFDRSRHGHIRVARCTCYVCHFMSQPFNEGTGRCLGCHAPPTGKVRVQDAVRAAGQAGGAAITVDHAAVVARDVDCTGCHADSILGTGQVTRRHCEACHDQAQFLEGFDKLTSETVRRYHHDHATDQRARCEDCHSSIEHESVPVEDQMAQGQKPSSD